MMLNKFTGTLGLLIVFGHTQPGDTLTLERARKAAHSHPSLSALNLEVQARERQADQAAAFPNPRLGVEAENFAGTGPFTGTQGLETTARLEQAIELGGKRALRRESAKVEERLAQADLVQSQTDIERRLREGYAEAAKLQGRSRLLAQDTAFLLEIVEVSRRRMQAGGGSVAEDGKLRLLLSRSRLELSRNRSEMRAALQRLAFLMNLSKPDFSAVQESALDSLPDWETVTRNVERHPELLRWRSEKELRTLSVRSAKAQNIPDLDLNAGVRRLNAEGGWALVGGVSVPLPIWNRNRGAVSGSERRLEGSEQSEAATRLELLSEAYTLWTGLHSKNEEIERLRVELLPEAVRMREASRSAYAQGRFGVLDLLDGQRTWLELNEHYLDLVAEYRQDAGKLDALAGVHPSFETENTP